MSPTEYLSRFSEEAGTAWNYFWFTPASVRSVAALRVRLGGLLLAYFLGWTGYLSTWFATDGLLPSATVKAILTETGRQSYHWSPLNYLESPAALGAFHIATLGTAVGLLLGVGGRLPVVLSLAALLSHVHRAPMLTSPVETVLTFLLLYLLLAPRGGGWYPVLKSDSDSRRRHWLANLSLKLCQVHTAMFLLLVACAALSSEGWWNGTAVWMLESQTIARPLDISGIRNFPYLVNFWTHAFVGVNLLAPVLLWNRLWRPLVIWATQCIWLTMLLVVGQPLYIFAVVVAISTFWADHEEDTRPVAAT